jgi:hypothetical protein
VDNLKAAVLKADWFDPEINPKLADFCRHYGLNVMPCRPAKPQHNRKKWLLLNRLSLAGFELIGDTSGRATPSDSPFRPQPPLHPK